MRKPKAKKALAKGENRAVLSSATLIAGRANVYREMENSACDLARAADLAMHVFDKPDPARRRSTRFHGAAI
jgi:hypothetical protein